MNVYISFTHNNPNWKEHKCSSVRVWTNCGIFIDGKLLSHEKELLTHKSARMPYLHERRQTQIGTFCVIQFM